jgi:hypothetical protein
LGLLHAYEWVRTKVRGLQERNRDKNSRAPQDKESQRWVAGYEEVVRQSQQHEIGAKGAKASRAKPRLIMVGDREADIYELFLAAQHNRECCGLLVRAVHPRRLEEQNSVVWDHLRDQPESGRLSVEVPAQGSRPARIATLSVRSAAVRLSVPGDKQYHFGASEALEVWAIEAAELQAPAGQQPLHWKLLGSEEAKSFAQASRQLKWYAKRWNIEVFHKTLKSGCRTEDRQLGTHEGLVRMLMVDAIVAWRLMAVTYAARHQPDALASAWLDDVQWRVLSCWATKRPPPAQAPSIKEAVTWIARLGGFLGRKSDGSPGVQSLWLGFLRLQPMVELWNAQKLVGND